MARKRIGRRPGLGLALAGTLLVGTVGIAFGTHLASDTEDHTTLEQILAGDAGAFRTLSVDQVNDEYIVRAPDALGQPQDGRQTRRESLAYFSQLTDFQLADEESPSRVEFLDGGAHAAWRPQEAFHPFFIDESIRQINRFTPASPVPQGDGTANSMDFSLITGDQADNQQRNEIIWTRALLEGTPTNFGSGISDPAFYANPSNLTGPSCAAFFAQEGGDSAAAAAEGAAYTGVQDYDDYPADPGPSPAYYDPDDPRGDWAAFPQWTGLMDRAQTLTLNPAGLDVPSYWTNGNHDVLAQGNEDANQAVENIATGCFKALGTTIQPGPGVLDPGVLLAPTAAGMLVPPDPLRRYVSRPQIKAIVGANSVDDGHGFDFVDPDENTASNGTASYYGWDPPETPGLHFINIDTNSEGGVVGPSANGNLDDPQFQWLKSELDAAQAANKLIVIFGHHPVRTLNASVPDEAAAACTSDDTHGDTPEHDQNPGCDLDPRSSEPLHLGEPSQPGANAQTLKGLIDGYPNVIAYVAGHTHEHKLVPFIRPDGSAWWEINTSATADWPQQHRLIEIMDNGDGTLSIFGTVLDAAADATAPAPGAASGFSSRQLASIGRTISYNDPQGGPPTGEGGPEDRNVEMLVRDPRLPRPRASVCTNTINGTPGDDNGPDTLVGTTVGDRIFGFKGADTLKGLAGNDCLFGQRGSDLLKGGTGDDRLRGSAGGDILIGGLGRDRIKGGLKADKIKVRDRKQDIVNCGPGKDLVIADRSDVLKACERIRLPKNLAARALTPRL